MGAADDRDSRHTGLAGERASLRNDVVEFLAAGLAPRVEVVLHGIRAGVDLDGGIVLERDTGIEHPRPRIARVADGDDSLLLGTLMKIENVPRGQAPGDGCGAQRAECVWAPTRG